MTRPLVLGLSLAAVAPASARPLPPGGSVRPVASTTLPHPHNWGKMTPAQRQQWIEVHGFSDGASRPDTMSAAKATGGKKALKGRKRHRPTNTGAWNRVKNQPPM